ncbi:hypothetical protein ACIA5D_41340 [Actinoplanes sp. NPDC051513]|uniref:hypothetical protein n=1 Tax=Actinoplanes sp. NPDC051513 TaxID=3363908 RepID=UPI0037993E34
MDSSQIREQLRRRAEELLAEPPLETVRGFLATEIGDAADFEEARDSLAQLAQVNIRSHQRELWALERVIADPPAEPGALARLVAWDANWVLDDTSDAAALQFLREVAQMLREVIEAAPPTADRWRSWPPQL